MHVRCPWWFAVAIGFVILLGCTVALKVETGHLASTIISNAIMVSTTAVVTWWLYREDMARRDEREVQRELAQLYREVKSRGTQ